MCPGLHSRQSQVHIAQAGHTFSGSQQPCLPSRERPPTPLMSTALPVADPHAAGPHRQAQAPVIARARELADFWNRALPPWEDKMDGTVRAAQA